MEILELLIEVLEKSVAKNGNIPLTNQHLLNIVKMAKKWKEKDDDLQSTYDPNWD